MNLRSIFLLALSFAFVSLAIPISAVRAARSPILTISPSSQPLAPPGSIVTFTVNVSNISPIDPLVGWTIYVVTNSSILNPLSVTLGSFLLGASEFGCINGVSVVGECTSLDGPGVVSLGAFTPGPGNSGNGTLFTISYTAVAGPYAFLSFLSANASPGTELLDYSGNLISVTALGGSYGIVPPLPVASFNYSPQQPLVGDGVTFNATTSSGSPGHKIVDYRWTFTPLNGSAIIANGIVTSRVFDAGNWTITLVVRDDQGAVSQPYQLSIHVPIGDFSLTPSSPVTIVCNNLSRCSTPIRVIALSGFNGTVSFAFSTSLPPGGMPLDFTCQPPLSVIGTGSSSLSCYPYRPGDYAVTVTGTSGSLSHSTGNLTFHVVYFGLDFNTGRDPAILSMKRGNSTTLGLVFTSLNGFSGLVTLSATMAEAGGVPLTSKSPSITLAANSLSLSSGGTATSMLTITTSRSPKGDGFYQVIVSATSGSIRRELAVYLTVTKG